MAIERSKQFCLIIEMFDEKNNKYIDIKRLLSKLDETNSIVYYACILHDRDTFDNGELKRPHYHLVLEYKNMINKSTCIMDFARELCVSADVISCRVVKDMDLSIQYLIHANDKDKYQYDMFDLDTNNSELTINVLNDICKYRGIDIDVNLLCELVYKYDNLNDVYRELGLANALKYRALINDIYRFKHYERSKN